MGRYYQETESRSELQQRIAADLRAKAMQTSNQDGEADDMLVENSQYLKGTKRTTTLAPAWILIIIMTIGVFALFVYQVNR